jgi:predicted NBD/HSP70 family sugar kinase
MVHCQTNEQAEWKMNEKLLTAVNIIRKSASLRRQELAQRMGISLSLVNKIISTLLDAGLVDRRRSEEPEMGRPADLLSIRADAGLVVGMDFHDDRYVAVVMDLAGAVLSTARVEMRMPTDREAMLERITAACGRAVADAGRTDARVLGLGLAAYGIVDPVSGTIDGWECDSGWLHHWVGVSLRDALARAAGYPVILVDDVVRALGTAEALYGAGSRQKTFVYVIADEGTGMAIMQDGRPYIGFSHIAGEIAHIPVGAEDKPCMCGSSGCLCTVVSPEELRRKLRERLAESPVRSVLRDAAEQATMADVVRAAADGDKLAVRIMSEFGDCYGKALAVVLNLFGPELVVLGGTLAGSGPFMEAVRRTAHARALQRATEGVGIERSTLRETGAAQGAAAMVLDELFESRGRDLLSLFRRA